MQNQHLQTHVHASALATHLVSRGKYHDVCFGASLHRSTLDKYLDIVHGGQEVERTERSKMTLP
jgi:heme oxygenase